MKRPPELLLLSAVMLVVIFQNIDALRGTQVVFRKTSTTSTTETVPESERRKDEISEVTEIAESTEPTTPKSNFTGIPQLDYIFDPNLPRELNGYNLSSYPFYSLVPDNITFKCDGLHDGFYASVDHKCQVYHQCLFSTRFDFLCANYTAFDQKTFICHFVSEVDCVNSPKYFSRNDALYQTTTTMKPTPIVVSPALTAVPRKPHTGLRRPKPTKRRPQYEYYDEEYDDEGKEEYYEEPPRRRRKRPRPRRPRPIYDDDYDDYDDERYERRSTGRNKDENYRKSQDRRPYESEENSRDKDGFEETRSKGDHRKPDDHKSRDEEPAYNDKEDDRRYDSRDERRPYDKNHRNNNNNNNKHSDNSKSENRNVEGSRVDNPRVDDRRVDDRRNDDRRKDDRRNDDRRNDDRRNDDRRNDDRQSDDRRNDDRQTDDRRAKGDGRRGDDGKVDDRRMNKHKSGDRRPDYDERDEDSYRFDRDRRKGDGRRKRPNNDEVADNERPRVKGSNSNRDYNDRRPLETASSFDSPRKYNRKPYEDDEFNNDDKDERRSFDRPRKPENKDKPLLDNNDRNIENKPRQDTKPQPEKEENILVKPNSSSSVFNQPRAPPRIKPPVPKNEQSKYAYKTSTEKAVVKVTEKEEEYYDDYEDEPNLTTKFKENDRKAQPSSTEKEKVIENKRIVEPSYGRSKVTTFKPPTTEPTNDYIENKQRPRRPNTKPNYDYRENYGPNNPNRAKLPVDEKTVPPPVVRAKNNYFNREQNTNQYSNKNLKNEIEISSTAAPFRVTEPVVKIVKRPFLPSRGGNPYSLRGLQPVGSRSLNIPTSISPITDDVAISKTNENVNNESLRGKENYRSSSGNVENYSNSDLNGSNIKSPEPETENHQEESGAVNTQNTQQIRFSRPIENDQQEEIRPISNRPETVLSQQADFDDYDVSEREKSTIQEKNPLDIINEDEYDVTLNDALSPTLPNLPLRNFRSPYSVSTDYTFRNFQRPGYSVAPNQPADNSYQVRSSSQRVESVAKPVIVEDSRKRYTNQYRNQNEDVYQNPNFRPHSQLTQAQTHAFYPVY